MFRVSDCEQGEQLQRVACCLLHVLHAPLIALSKIIGAHGTDVSVGVRLLSGETFLQAKNSTGRRWDSNPGPCR